jgi:L-seryl-tRNA(Ser) seleniumtransferase
LTDDHLNRQDCLRSIPSVEEVLQSDLLKERLELAARAEVISAVRTAIALVRESIIRSDAVGLTTIHRNRSRWIRRIVEESERFLQPSLRPLINATGVIIHTNLGRSLLADDALEAIYNIASRYSNLEYDRSTGQRGSRYVHVEGLLCRLTGAEAATVVNNNAGAVLIALNTLARGKEVVVSRGELVEIGGSFRMPEVMAHSGARLVEVGTTNKTHVSDYQNAISSETGLLLKVHPSNFRILGFTEEVSLEAMVALGRQHGIPVMHDLGSGCLLDLADVGLEPEPTVQQALGTGVDLVTFSGDKLLGGPQAGLILGKREFVERIRKNPLNRALRIDKLTLAALEATLRLYWDPSKALIRIPTLQMMSSRENSIRRRARRLARRISKEVPSGVRIQVRPDSSQVGGGSFPLLQLPTWVVGIQINHVPASRLNGALREAEPPVIVRIQKEEVLLDLRTVRDEEIPLLARTVVQVVPNLLASAISEVSI